MGQTDEIYPRRKGSAAEWEAKGRRPKREASLAWAVWCCAALCMTMCGHHTCCASITCRHPVLSSGGHTGVDDAPGAGLGDDEGLR